MGASVYRREGELGKVVLGKHSDCLTPRPDSGERGAWLTSPGEALLSPRLLPAPSEPEPDARPGDVSVCLRLPVMLDIESSCRSS